MDEAKSKYHRFAIAHLACQGGLREGPASLDRARRRWLERPED